MFLASMAGRAGSKQPLTRGRYRLYLPVLLCRNLAHVTMEQKRRKSQGCFTIFLPSYLSPNLLSFGGSEDFSCKSGVF